MEIKSCGLGSGWGSVDGHGDDCDDLVIEYYHGLGSGWGSIDGDGDKGVLNGYGTMFGVANSSGLANGFGNNNGTGND